MPSGHPVIRSWDVCPASAPPNRTVVLLCVCTDTVPLLLNIMSVIGTGRGRGEGGSVLVKPSVSILLNVIVVLGRDPAVIGAWKRVIIMYVCIYMYYPSPILAWKVGWRGKSPNRQDGRVDSETTGILEARLARGSPHRASRPSPRHKKTPPEWGVRSGVSTWGSDCRPLYTV